jgi:hypothetical protein
MSKHKQLLVLMPQNIRKGQPSFERIHSFIDFYERQNVSVHVYNSPVNLKEKFRLILFIYRHSVKNIFISMPPFRNWYLFLIPKINIILDIRDGWSIAIKSGYGGLVRPNRIKYKLCKVIERMAMNKNSLTITCTPGLKTYLQSMSKKEIILLTNGISQKDIDIIKKLKKNGKSTDTDIAICTGGFSEYGIDKVKIILHKINKTNVKTLIKLIGVNPDKNLWIDKWLHENEINNISVVVLPWMSRSEMYQEIVNSDYGISVIRDPNYEFGTKIFDYIHCGIPVFNYFDNDNAFTVFFEKFLTNSKKMSFEQKFIREEILNEQKEILMESLKHMA